MYKRMVRMISFLLALGFLSCNPVNGRDEYLLTLVNGLNPTTAVTTSFTIGTSSKINVTSASVILYYGTPQLFGFSLVSPPTANVTLAFTNSKLNAIGNLTFTPANYSTIQTITLTSNTQLMESSSLSVSATSADPNYSGISGSITINHRNVNIVYTGSSFIFKEDDSAPSLNPVLGFPITNCSVAPALPNGLTLNTSTCVISGTPTDSQAGTTYTVTATDGTNTDTENITIRITPTVYRIFITATSYDGNLQGASANGPAGADLKCNSDANTPGTGTYKAMITDGTNRNACSTDNCGGGAGENIDWVFQSGRIYIRANDAASLFTANASGIINAPAANMLSQSFASGTTKYFWTGFAQTNYWQEATAQTTNSCNNWTTNANTATASEGGRVGASNTTDYTAFRSGSGRSCDTFYYLLCVEQ
ncbi:DUF1554 domain-containing protein [Leptospira levettii]|uniref:DUF1554 domain-containing protein n=1 Tax=Leptospira levettii TaxID=2023178 RepID=UPI001FEEFB8B|nr:DUF1554 domain-containing protein [Leptospira levettii]